MSVQDALEARWFEILPYNTLSVTLLGCGGTGSKLAPEICQALTLLKQHSGRQINFDLLLVDPDKVEEHNLVRQHFTWGDLGRHKAQVLAERYAGAFGIPVSYSLSLVDEPNDLWTLLALNRVASVSRWDHLSVLFTAVDNHPTRRVVSEAVARFSDSCSFFWVDLANEAVAGHVSIGAGIPARSVTEIHALPFVTEVFPEILTESPDLRPSQLPCGAGGVQDLNVNAAAATHAASFFRRLLKCLVNDERRLVNYHLVEFGVCPPSAVIRHNTPQKFQEYSWLTSDRRRLALA